MVATRWSVHIFGTPRAITKVVQRKVPGALTSPGAN
jgi:hypothetical protein